MRTRFAIAFIATVVVGLVVLGGHALLAAMQPHAPSRPTISPTAPYRLIAQDGDQPSTTVDVSADGGGCEVVRRSDYLYRACVLAVNLDPAVIAGEAFGRINLEPTPAREGLIWRAVLDGDPGICSGGGLEGEPLDECLGAVGEERRVVTDAGLRVEVSTP
jgi:hypothetical protein